MTTQRLHIAFDATAGAYQAYWYGEHIPGWFASYLEAEAAVDAYEREQQQVLDLRRAVQLLERNCEDA